MTAKPLARDDRMWGFNNFRRRVARCETLDGVNKSAVADLSVAAINGRACDELVRKSASQIDRLCLVPALTGTCRLMTTRHSHGSTSRSAMSSHSRAGIARKGR